jgi:hypothetical protein
VVEEGGGRAADEIKRLKLLIQQKDNEMALLVSLIKKKTGENNYAVIPREALPRRRRLAQVGCPRQAHALPS